MSNHPVNPDADDPTVGVYPDKDAAVAVAEAPANGDATRQAMARSTRGGRVATTCCWTSKSEENFHQIRGMVEAAYEKIKAVLPAKVSPERMIRIALGTIARSERLMQCDPKSIVVALLTAAELGLDAGGAAGQSYLVPYKDGKSGQYLCQLIPGYRGLIDLARRSGQVVSVQAYLVHENDQFDVELGTQPHIRHVPTTVTGDAGPVVAAYAVAELVNGSRQFEVMNIQQLEAVRKRSKAAGDGPWVTDTNEMYRKTVVRRLCKYLPSSHEMERALELDALAEA